MNDGHSSQLVPTNNSSLSSNPASVANSEETIEDYWSAIEELVNSNTLQEQNTPSPTERPDLQLPDDIKAQVLFNFEAFMQNGDQSDPWNIGSQLDPNNNEEKDAKDPSYMNAIQALYNSGQPQASPVAQTQPSSTLVRPSVVPQSSLVQQVSLAQQLTSPLAQQQSSPLVQHSPSLQSSIQQPSQRKSLQQASLQQQLNSPLQRHSPLQGQSPLQQASPAASTLTSSGAPDMSYFFYPQTTSENKPVVLPALTTSEELKLKIESPESLRSLLLKSQSALGDSFNRKVQFSLPTPDHTPEESNSPPTTMPKLMSHSTMESVSSLLKLSSAHAVSDLMGEHKFLPSSTSTTSTASSISGYAPMDLTFLSNNQGSADESMYDDESLGDSSFSAETPSRLITDDELISFSVRDLNRRLASATKAEAQQAKKRRRLLKNRGYAAICRTKRITHAQSLQTENNYLKELCQRLIEERDLAVSERNVVKEKYENLKLMIRKAKKVQKEKLQNPQQNSTGSTTEL